MKCRLALVALALIGLLLPSAASADGDPDEIHRFGFGLGLGLVEPSDELFDTDAGAISFDDETATYFAANLRILLGDKDRYGKRSEETVLAYVEPEIGYWESDEGAIDASDFLVGVNLVGVVPFRKVDFFFGAGLGVHFFDSQFSTEGLRLDESSEEIGVNAQTGLDVRLGEDFELFGLVRFDLVDGARFEEQRKIYLGVRFLFGDDDDD